MRHESMELCILDPKNKNLRIKEKTGNERRTCEFCNHLITHVSHVRKLFYYSC